MNRHQLNSIADNQNSVTIADNKNSNLKEPSKSTSETRLSGIVSKHCQNAFKSKLTNNSLLADILAEIAPDYLSFKTIDNDGETDVSTFERYRLSNQKKLERYIKQEVLMPLDLVPCIIEALPEPFSSYARIEVSNALLPVKKQQEIDSSDAIRELSQAITAITGDDANHQIKELSEAIEAADMLLASIKSENGGAK